MPPFHAFVLGLTQGITEFLPISSSGFLILIPERLGWDVQSILFDGVLHLATLTAVIFALKKEIGEILHSVFFPSHASKQTRSLFWWIMFATIPVLFAGFLMQEVFDISFRSTRVVAFSFIVWGMVLFVADRFAHSRPDQLTDVGWKRGLGIGFAQILALIPGTSRSGITITAGLVGGLSRETATTFSFLLSIPVIFATGMLSIVQLITYPETESITSLLIGGFTAFFSAFIVIQLLRKWLKKYTFSEFAVFRVVIGLLLLL